MINCLRNRPPLFCRHKAAAPRPAWQIVEDSGPTGYKTKLAGAVKAELGVVPLHTGVRSLCVLAVCVGTTASPSV